MVNKMWNPLVLAAFEKLCGETQFTDLCLSEQTLAYTACLDNYKTVVETPWKRIVWHSSLRLSNRLQGKTTNDDEALSAARLDWESRIPLQFAHKRNGVLYFSHRDMVRQMQVQDPEKLIACRAVRLGYHVVEVQGEGLVVRAPSGKSLAVQMQSCDCAEGQQGKKCVHVVLANIYQSNRKHFQDFHDDCLDEYQRHAGLH